MSRIDPLPFRLPMAGSDSLNWDGARSVSYRLEGLLHLANQTVTIEWTGSKQTQNVTFGEVTDDVDHYPIEWIDIPVSWIHSVRLTGGWWAPRLRVASRQIAAFDGIPTAKPGSLTLKIRRRDRERARAMVAAIEGASQADHDTE